MSYDTPPIDTSTGNLVKNLRHYLATNAGGSWDRQPNIRMVCNGVTEANNPKESPSSSNLPPSPLPTATPAPNKTCNGLAANKYVERDALQSAIQDHFCPDAVAQGRLDKDSASIMRRYNQGTMDDVTVAINYAPGLNFKPNTADCVNSLLGDVTDGCDGNDPTGNPDNYRGGGIVNLGAVGYQIEPQAVRQLAKSGLQGGRDSTYKFLWNEYTMWGHGFASGDFGMALKGQIGGCALLPDTWSFQYGLGSDGREWTAKFRTGVFQRGCVGHATIAAEAPGDFGCAGSG